LRIQESLSAGLYGNAAYRPDKSPALVHCAILVIVLASMAYSTHRIRRENIIDELKQETF